MMNRIKIGLYLLITTVLLTLLNIYIASTEMYRGKTRQIDANYLELGEHEGQGAPSNRVVLVIGNSYVAASFDPDKRGDGIVLFRVSGMPMVDILGIIEHLPETTVVDTVLIGLGYNYASPVGGTSSSYDVHFTNNPLHRAWVTLPLIRGRSIASTALKEDVKCLFAHFFTIRCSKARGNEFEVGLGERTATTPDDPVEHLKRIRKSTQRRYQEYEPFTSQVSGSFLVYLQRMQEACKRRDIKLYAYTAPIYSELRQKLTQETLEEFRATVSLAGIEYVDLNLVFPDWDAMMFSDATHVEKVVAGKQITDYLLNYIDSHSAY